MSSPLEQELVELLDAFGNDDYDILKPAEAQLIRLETADGYFTTLVCMSVNTEYDLAVRLGAILRVKNSVMKLVKRSMEASGEQAATARAELAVLKRLLLEFLFTCSEIQMFSVIFAQFSTIIMLLAIELWPGEWPELIPSLMQLINSTNRDVMRRGLTTLKKVIKHASLRKNTVFPKSALVEQCIAVTPIAISNCAEYSKLLWMAYTQLFPHLNDVNSQASSDVSSARTLTSEEEDDLETLSKLTLCWIKLLKYATVNGNPCVPELLAFDASANQEYIPSAQASAMAEAFYTFLRNLRPLSGIFQRLLTVSCASISPTQPIIPSFIIKNIAKSFICLNDIIIIVHIRHPKLLLPLLPTHMELFSSLLQNSLQYSSNTLSEAALTPEGSSYLNSVVSKPAWVRRGYLFLFLLSFLFVFLSDNDFLRLGFFLSFISLSLLSSFTFIIFHHLFFFTVISTTCLDFLSEKKSNGCIHCYFCQSSRSRLY